MFVVVGLGFVLAGELDLIAFFVVAVVVLLVEAFLLTVFFTEVVPVGVACSTVFGRADE